MIKVNLFFMMVYKSFIGQVRQYKRNIMLFMIPISIFLFIYLFFTFSKVEESFIEPVNIGLIIEDDSMYGKMLANSLINTDSFSNFANITQGNYEDISNEFDLGNLDAMVIMPEGFVKSIMSFSSNPIIVKINYEEPLKALIIKNILLSYEKYISTVEVGIMTLFDQMEELNFDWDTIISYNEKISLDLVFTALSRNNMFKVNEIVDIPSVASTIYFFIALIVMFLMYISVYSAINLIKEREDMCLVRLKTTKISMFSYITSKAIGGTLYMSTIVLSWFLLFIIFTNWEVSKLLILICIFLIISILFNLSFSMFFTAFMNKEEGVVLLSNVFIFFNAIIGGSIIPIQMMPDTLQKISVISPNYWMIKGFLYFQSGYNIKEGIYIGIIFLILSFVLLLITSKKFDYIS